MIGGSPSAQRTREQLRRVAGSEASVLICGETGTDKALAAAFVHAHSRRRDGPFLRLDCAAMTDERFESWVFGRERGAPTASLGAKPGIFELADGGTLFLDKLAELPLIQQAKLLRALETGEFRRVGGVTLRSANVRIICATNREIRDRAWFRQDLYYRVACFRIEMPSLDECAGDLQASAQEILGETAASSSRAFQLAPEAREALKAYPYPGNIRAPRSLLRVAGATGSDGIFGVRAIDSRLPKTSWPEGDLRRAAPLGHCGARRAPASLGSLANRETWQLRAMRGRRGKHRCACAKTSGIRARALYRKPKGSG